MFVHSAPVPHLHESWLLSSSANDEMKDGVPVSLSTYYKPCWEIWSPFFFPRLPPWNTYIISVPFIHDFSVATDMSPREMEAKSNFESTSAADERPIVLSCSPHSPQEIRNTNVKAVMRKKETCHSPLLFTCLPLCSLSIEVLYHLQRWSGLDVQVVHCVIQTGSVI